MYQKHLVIVKGRLQWQQGCVFFVVVVFCIRVIDFKIVLFDYITTAKGGDFLYGLILNMNCSYVLGFHKNIIRL